MNLVFKEIIIEMSRFFGKEDAEAAVKYFRQRFEEFIREKGKLGIHVVILDPGSKGEILYEESILHDRWKGEKRYDEIARGKALLSEREQMHNGDVPKCKLLIGDIIFRGGVYYNGFSVGISGLVSEDDQDKGLELAEYCEVIANRNFSTWKKANKDAIFVTAT